MCYGSGGSVKRQGLLGRPAALSEGQRNRTDRLVCFSISEQEMICVVSTRGGNAPRQKRYPTRTENNRFLSSASESSESALNIGDKPYT
jgi:hypothetical protein